MPHVDEGKETRAMAQPPPPFAWQTLAADLFAHYHEPVLAWLARRCRSVDRDLLHDAFVQTLLEICRKPERFDPARGNLGAFLRGATWRTLRSRLRSEGRRRRREQKRAESLVAREGSAAREILDELADRELARKVRAEVARTDAERVVLRLWELGVEDMAEYARQLGLADRPEAEQRAIVKTIRDRLTKRLHRLKDRFEAEGAGP
jgi:hypothetical protein